MHTGVECPRTPEAAACVSGEKPATRVDEHVHRAANSRRVSRRSTSPIGPRGAAYPASEGTSMRDPGASAQPRQPGDNEASSARPTDRASKPGTARLRSNSDAPAEAAVPKSPQSDAE